MIGNDIVDRKLAAKESNWQRRGFLGKLFHSHEIETILASADPELTVWILWSMKESVYKIINRQTGIRHYNPMSFQIRNAKISNHSASAEVRYESQCFIAQSEITNELIHTIAVENEQQFSKIQSLGKSAPIFKQKGLPFLDNQFTKPVSVSHHGRFTRRICLMQS
ncbi:MAG: 4-phosphopantetheinyl transferase family protein [Flavobacterium sp.]|nr:4-phosphopantetheinyl transferase family protein [Flavobacterium sp.]